MAYIKFKELSKYFDFKLQVKPEELPSYVEEYVEDCEEILIGYKNSKDYVVFTDKKMILFDRDTLAVYYKSIYFLIDLSHLVQLILSLVK